MTPVLTPSETPIPGSGADPFLPGPDPADSPYYALWSLIESVLDRVGLEEQRETIARTFELVCRESLRFFPGKGGGHASAITRSGLPFEFSFTSNDTPGTFRMLSEAAPAGIPLSERAERTVHCLRELGALYGVSSGALDGVLSCLFPNGFHPAHTAWYHGAMWLSTRFAPGLRPALRVYANQQRNNNAYRFVNPHRLFQLLGQPWNCDRLQRIFELTDPWAEVSGVSFDLRPDGIAGVKLYLGATGATAERILSLLGELGLVEAGDQVLHFLDRMNLVKTGFSGPSLLVSVEFPDSAGLPVAVKFDVTTRELFTSDREVYRAACDLLHRFRLHPMGFRACEDLFFPGGFPDGPVGVLQYLGLGVSPGARLRLNLYLAPPVALPAPGERGAAGHRFTPRPLQPSPERSATVAAIGQAVDYLMAGQSQDGAWWDLTVSAGSSGPWLTSVVGEILAALPRRVQSAGLLRCLERAADLVERAELPEGGWGYNEALPADCDSTAQCVNFLHALGRPVSPRAVDCLRSLQRPPGAFLTYVGAPAGHAWGTVHHDVNPVAVRALAAVAGIEDPAVAAGLKVMLGGLSFWPVWPAFWWKTQSYGAYANLLCLSQIGRLAEVPATRRGEIIGLLAAGDALEAALGGIVSLLLGEEGAAPFHQTAWRHLVKSQNGDGSWPATRSLRVVNCDCPAPWEQPDERLAGPSYCDRRRIFTTALALRCLSLHLEARFGP